MAESVTRVAIGLIEAHEHFVVGTRADGVLAGHDEFPGGKCRPGETPETAVVRECLEETGLTVVVQGLRQRREFTYPHGQLELYFFDCRLREASARLPALSAPFRWTGRPQLALLHFPPANAEVVQGLRSSRPPFA